MEFVHSCQSPVWYRAEVVVLDLQDVQAAWQAQWEGLESVPGQVQLLQESELPEGLAVQLGVGEFVVAQVEFRQGEEQSQVVTTNFRDLVVEQHQDLGPARKTSGNSLQKVVVHVQRVQLLQSLQGTGPRGNTSLNSTQSPVQEVSPQDQLGSCHSCYHLTFLSYF